MKMVMDIWLMMTVMTTMPVFSQMQKNCAMVLTTIATVKRMKMSKLPSMLMQMMMDLEMLILQHLLVKHLRICSAGNGL